MQNILCLNTTDFQSHFKALNLIPLEDKAYSNVFTKDNNITYFGFQPSILKILFNKTM